MDNSTVEAVCKILCPTVIGCEQRQRMDKILKDAGYVKGEPAEGELISRTIIQATIDYVMQLDMIADPNIRDNVETAVIEGAKAQLAHDKATMGKQLSELQGVCSRLLQDNTELTEKVAKMVKLPSESQLLIWLQDLSADYSSDARVAQELLKLLKGEHDEA